MPDWGRAVGRVLEGGLIPYRRRYLIRMRRNQYFQLHFELRKGTKLPWRGTFATPRPWGHCVVLLQGLVVTGLKAWW